MQRVHFIGIGGAGMSGLAEILLARGTNVSGSDLVRSEKTEELKKQGAHIFIGHDAKHISSDIDTVVYSSAVRNSGNPELIEAEKQGIKTIRRADFLGELTRGIPTIAVSGTHGKTTTSSMIAHIMIESGLDPLVSIGAKVKELGGKNARAGKGNIAVVEADEYDRSFLALHPSIAVITTLEAEHLDIYKDLADLEETFVRFVNNRDGDKEQGYAVVNIDEPAVRDILAKLEKKIITFGVTSDEAKYKAKDISVKGFETRATIIRGGETLGELVLGVPGEHNIKNALAAIAVSDILAIPFERAKTSLMTFRGAERRADVIGEAGGVLVIDDYAHHPTEIRATLSAIRKGYPGRRIIASFQPHTFTRTRDFAEEFGKVFGDLSDELLLLDVYPAREKPIVGVTSDLILRSYKKKTGIIPFEELPQRAADIAKEGDIILTIGAGTITEAAPKILAKLKEKTKKR
ncbi:MAG TPA: UDP-N-acetylmuramate--L-alanine ligase [Candidatus Kapabacteria bacterium]